MIRLTRRYLTLNTDARRQMTGRILSAVRCEDCGCYQPLPDQLILWEYDPYDYCVACFGNRLVYDFEVGAY